MHNSSQFQQAAEKYERARNNVKDDPSKEAMDLKRSCMLNLSSCYLNLKEYSKCIAECDLVLSGVWGTQVHMLFIDVYKRACMHHPRGPELSCCIPLIATGDADNLKALYRRGQALSGANKWQAAARDLERAVRLSAHDPAQQRLIRDKLQEAEEQISMARSSGTLIESSGEHRRGGQL